jgi:membrane-associated PAP2 superfamily phosphatase
MNERRFGLNHAILPGIAFLVLAALFAFTDLDLMIARAWAYDAASGGFPAREAWWANELIHSWGKYSVWAVGLGSIGLWLASYRSTCWREYRRAALFVFLGIGAGTLCVAILKGLTNVDCPWDLIGFGGTRPYVHLFADRPDNLPHAACFPGAHSSSGFALMALYFAARERHRRAAWCALVLAILVGAVFSFGQEARGAHFLSHDLWSASIVWFVELALYAGVFRARLWQATAV